MEKEVTMRLESDAEEERARNVGLLGEGRWIWATMK
jgi:hypothetical protein